MDLGGGALYHYQCGKIGRGTEEVYSIGLPFFCPDWVYLGSSGKHTILEVEGGKYTPPQHDSTCKTLTQTQKQQEA